MRAAWFESFGRAVDVLVVDLFETAKQLAVVLNRIGQPIAGILRSPEKLLVSDTLVLWWPTFVGLCSDEGS